MEYDSETELYHTWFRQYDPKQGRWLAPASNESDRYQAPLAPRVSCFAFRVSDLGFLVEPAGGQRRQHDLH